MPARSTRNDLVDALKFFAIALVPLQHLLNLRAEFTSVPWAHAVVMFMVSFDMPLFVFLSGYVLFGREGSNPVVFLQRKALALLVPYFTWVSVEMLIERVPVGQWASTLGWAAIQPHRSYQMWFLWVLFALFAVFTAARLASRADLWLAAVGLTIGAIRFLPRDTTAGLDKIALLMPYLVLGYLCAKHRDALRPHDRWIAVLGVSAFGALSFVAQPSVPVQFAVATGGIVTVWAIHRLLPGQLVSAEAWVGRKSLGIYAGQMVTLPLVLVMPGAGWLGVAVSEVTTMTASTLLAWTLEATVATRAVFLGQWPKPALRRPAKEGDGVMPLVPAASQSAEEAEG